MIYRPLMFSQIISLLWFLFYVKDKRYLDLLKKEEEKKEKQGERKKIFKLSQERNDTIYPSK